MEGLFDKGTVEQTPEGSEGGLHEGCLGEEPPRQSEDRDKCFETGERWGPVVEYAQGRVVGELTREAGCRLRQAL